MYSLRLALRLLPMRLALPWSTQVDDKILARNPDFEAAVRESFARQGLMRNIGAWLVEVEAGRVAIELPFTAALSQQAGFFHGAVLAAIGDSAGGYAAMTLMPPGSEVVTVEYKINFIRPAKGELLRAEGRVERQGQSISVVRVEVSCRNGDAARTCGVMQATMMQVIGPCPADIVSPESATAKTRSPESRKKTPASPVT